MSTPYQPYPQGQPDPYGQPPAPQGGAEGYLHGGPVGFGEAISLAFKNIVTFNGRASRSAFWWFGLFAFIIGVVVAIIANVTGVRILSTIFGAIFFLLTISLQVRRLHDSDRSGFWYFLALIPLIGGIAVLVLDLLPGTPGPNKYDQ